MAAVEASEVGRPSSTENTVRLCVDVPVGDSNEHGFVMWTTAFATISAAVLLWSAVWNAVSV